MLFHDATFPGRFHRFTTYLLLFKKAKRGLWLPRPFFLGLHPLFISSCFPYLSRTDESNVSQSSNILHQGISLDKYRHNPSDIFSTSQSFFIFPKSLVNVVEANGSLWTAKSVLNFGLTLPFSLIYLKFN